MHGNERHLKEQVIFLMNDSPHENRRRCVISVTFSNKKMPVSLPNQIRRNVILTKGEATPKYFCCVVVYISSVDGVIWTLSWNYKLSIVVNVTKMKT